MRQIHCCSTDHIGFIQIEEQCSKSSLSSSTVVATTCWNGTCDILTSAKLSVGYLVVGITRELDKELLLHCSSICINPIWSVLQQCIYLISYYSSTMLLPQGYHFISMCSDVILFNLCYTCAHHVYTMRNPCPLTSSPNPNFIQTLPDSSRP